MNTQNLLQKMSWVTIFLVLATLGVVAFWLIYPYRLPKYNTDPQKVKFKEINGGKYQTIYVDYCRYEQIFPNISRAFVDGIIYQVPSYMGFDQKLGCHVSNVQVYIPKTLPPGEYFLRTNYSWKVNPIRTIEKSINTERFTVIE